MHATRIAQLILPSFSYRNKIKRTYYEDPDYVIFSILLLLEAVSEQ